MKHDIETEEITVDEDIVERIKEIALEALNERGQFTDEQRDAIASAIQAVTAKFLGVLFASADTSASIPMEWLAHQGGLEAPDE